MSPRAAPTCTCCHRINRGESGAHDHTRLHPHTPTPFPPSRYCRTTLTTTTPPQRPVSYASSRLNVAMFSRRHRRGADSRGGAEAGGEGVGAGPTISVVHADRVALAPADSALADPSPGGYAAFQSLEMEWAAAGTGGASSPTDSPPASPGSPVSPSSFTGAGRRRTVASYTMHLSVRCPPSTRLNEMAALLADLARREKDRGGALFVPALRVGGRQGACSTAHHTTTTTTTTTTTHHHPPTTIHPTTANRQPPMPAVFDLVLISGDFNQPNKSDYPASEWALIAEDLKACNLPEDDGVMQLLRENDFLPSYEAAGRGRMPVRTTCWNGCVVSSAQCSARLRAATRSFTFNTIATPAPFRSTTYTPVRAKAAASRAQPTTPCSRARRITCL